jgi:hypothetical protein
MANGAFFKNDAPCSRHVDNFDKISWSSKTINSQGHRDLEEGAIKAAFKI